MVLPTPARAAIASIVVPWKPRSASSPRVASTISSRAASRRGRPRGFEVVCFGASEVQAGERRSPLRALRVLAQMPRFNPMKLMSESKSVIGLNMLTLWDEHDSLDELIDPLRELIDAGKIRPVVAQEFRLDDGAAAHRYMHERSNVGKVVLTL